MSFISIRVAIFLHWFAKPTATLLLYPGLGPTMLRRLEKVFQSTQAELLIFIKNPKNSIHVEQQIKQAGGETKTDEMYTDLVKELQLKNIQSLLIKNQER